MHVLPSIAPKYILSRCVVPRDLLHFIFAMLFICSLVTQSWGEELLAARIHHLHGRVEVSTDDGKTWSGASQGQDLYFQDTVRTDRLSRASLLMADQSLVKIAPQSTVKVVQVVPSPKIAIGLAVKGVLARANQSLYRMIRGRVWIRSSAAVLIETPAANVGIRGTEFGLAVLDNGDTYLSMLEGEARMFNQHGSIDVLSGEQGFCRPGSAPVKRILLDPEDAVQWSLTYPTPVSFRDYYFVSQDPGRLAAMLEDVEKRLAASPEDPFLRIEQGEILHDIGRWEEAQESFLAAEKHPSCRARARTGLGWLRLSLGDIEGARALFARADQPTEMSILGASLVLYKMGLSGESLMFVEEGLRVIGRKVRLLVQAAYLNLLSGQSKEALVLLEEATRIEPTALGYGLLSNVHLVHNKKGEALIAAQRAVKTSPFSSTAQVDLAWARQAHFDIPGALEAAQGAVGLDPQNTRALVTYGQLLFGSGSIAEAHEVACKVLEFSPNEPLAHNLVGYVLLARRKTDKAIESFENSIRLDSSQASPHLGLGISHMRKGDVEKALEEMLVATLLEPRESLNYTYLGKALYQVKEFDQALKALQKAKVLDPRDPSPHLYSGIIRTDLKEAAQAIEDLEKSVELNDNRAVYRSRFLLDQDRAVKNVNLARTYLGLGMRAMAKNRALLSLKDDPNNSAAHSFMSDVLHEELSFVALNSERFKALLLAPPNQNSFNSFNQYTSFFEAPQVGGSPEVRVGNHGFQEYYGDFWLSWDDLALREFGWYRGTEGFASNNFQRDWRAESTVKYQLGLNQDFLFSYQRAAGKRGDSDFFSPDLDREGKWKDDELILGYHIRTSPTSDILLAATWHASRNIIRDRERNEALFFIPPFFALRQVYDHWNHLERFWHFGGTHLFHLSQHRIAYGFEAYRGTSRLRETTDFLVMSPILPPFTFETRFRNPIYPWYVALYAQDTWRILPSLTLEGAVSYERTKDGTAIPFFSSEEFELERINPRAGVIFTPDSHHTLRLGFARYLAHPFILVPQLRPTDIAGFNILTDTLPSSLVQDLSFTWEAELIPRTFLKVDLFKRKVTEQLEDSAVQAFRSRTEDSIGGGIEFDAMFSRYFGANLGYLYTRTQDRPLELSYGFIPDRWSDLHRFFASLHFVHPAGWKGYVRAFHLMEEVSGNFGRVARPGVWDVQLWIEKELLQKHMTVAFAVDNALDRDELGEYGGVPSTSMVLLTRFNF